MTNVIEITLAQLLELIKSIRPSSFVGITQVTPARLRIRAGVAFGMINPKEAIKLTALNTHSGISYQNSERNKSGNHEFEAQESTYKLISNNKMLAENKKSGQKYFIYSAFENSNPKTKYIVDGKIVTKSNIPTDVLPKVYDTNRVTIWRTPKVENIRRIKIDGQSYKVVLT